MIRVKHCAMRAQRKRVFVSWGVRGDLLKGMMPLSTEGPVGTPCVRTEAGEGRESIHNQDF